MKKIIIDLIRFFCFFLIGFTLSFNGIHLNDISFWIILLSSCLVSILSMIGVKE